MLVYKAIGRRLKEEAAALNFGFGDDLFFLLCFGLSFLNPPTDRHEERDLRSKEPLLLLLRQCDVNGVVVVVVVVEWSERTRGVTNKWIIMMIEGECRRASRYETPIFYPFFSNFENVFYVYMCACVYLILYIILLICYIDLQCETERGSKNGLNLGIDFRIFYYLWR